MTDAQPFDAAARASLVEQLMTAHAQVAPIPPPSSHLDRFEVRDAYSVLAAIELERVAQGWQAVGRKVGFTNRGIWDRYRVDRPMWARMWDQTVRDADPAGRSVMDIAALMQPRIEPEVVFRLKAAVPATEDPAEVMRAVEWVAPGFEIVQCHFPEWRFTAADCTADFGLHAGLIIGTPIPVTEANRDQLTARLSTFTLTLTQGDTTVETGVGANVLGHPALALAYLTRIVRAQRGFSPLVAGEIVTTGTITDAWPISPGERWESDYGDSGLGGLRVAFT